MSREEQILEELNDLLAREGKSYRVGAGDMGAMLLDKIFDKIPNIRNSNTRSRVPRHIFSDARVAYGEAGEGRAGAKAEIGCLQIAIEEIYAERNEMGSKISTLNRKVRSLKKELLNTRGSNEELIKHVRKSAAKKEELREAKTRRGLAMKQVIEMIDLAASNGKKSFGKKFVQQIREILVSDGEGIEIPAEAVETAT